METETEVMDETRLAVEDTPALTHTPPVARTETVITEGEDYEVDPVEETGGGEKQTREKSLKDSEIP